MHHTPLKARRLEYQDTYPVSMDFDEPVWFTNCHQQLLNSTNPAHLMMKMVPKSHLRKSSSFYPQ